MLSAEYVSNATFPNVVSAAIPKVSLRKLYLSSTDAIVSGSQTWQFRLSAPMKNVVHIDWAMIAGITGPCLMSIAEIPNGGITSAAAGYFATLVGGTVQNQFRDPQPPPAAQPVAFNQLTIRLSGPSQTTDWAIELYVYVQE